MHAYQLNDIGSPVARYDIVSKSEEAVSIQSQDKVKILWKHDDGCYRLSRKNKEEGRFALFKLHHPAYTDDQLVETIQFPSADKAQSAYKVIQNALRTGENTCDITPFQND